MEVVFNDKDYVEDNGILVPVKKSNGLFFLDNSGTSNWSTSYCTLSRDANMNLIVTPTAYDKTVSFSYNKNDNPKNFSFGVGFYIDNSSTDWIGFYFRVYIYGKLVLNTLTRFKDNRYLYKSYHTHFTVFNTGRIYKMLGKGSYGNHDKDDDGISGDGFSTFNLESSFEKINDTLISVSLVRYTSDYYIADPITVYVSPIVTFD